MVTVQSPAPAPSAPSQPRGPVRAAPRRRRPGRLAAATTPTLLRILMIILLLASLAWGAVGAWAVSQHASAAQDVVSTSEPLSLSAQQMYRSLSDADVTAATAFLSGPFPSLPAQQRYDADLAQAGSDLTSLTAAATTAGNPQLLSSLNAVSTGLNVYHGYVRQAQTWYTLGHLLTGGSFMQDATETMHLTLLPAARAIYAQENAGLTTASAQATGLPWIVVVLVLAIAIGFVLFRAQRWLWHRTHRRVNYGLLGASLVLVVGVLWLIVAFAVASSDLQQGTGHGSTPAETLAQAAIDAQQIRGDELINLISRSGPATFIADFGNVRRQLGPGPGTLLASAAATSSGGAGAQWTAAASRDVQAWYRVNEQAYALDGAAQYLQETRLVTGTGPGSSTAGFTQVETDLSRAIAADQVIFQGSATSGENAFTGLEAGIVVIAVLMALGCAWGLNIRLTEYR
ncbi:MAG TPA: hypothetical protein VGR98_17725 [Streptosporangiaceae bacterium]|nr:hypothetical protein [Streptosporangiaceae bacterium]